MRLCESLSNSGSRDCGEAAGVAMKRAQQPHEALLVRQVKWDLQNFACKKSAKELVKELQQVQRVRDERNEAEKDGAERPRFCIVLGEGGGAAEPAHGMGVLRMRQARALELRWSRHSGK